MTILGPAVSALILAVAFLCTFRWIHRRSRSLAWVIAGVIAVRVAAGVVLTTLSVFDLSLLEHLRYADGFWQFAPDARTYQNAATAIMHEGFGALEPSMPSQTYIIVLSLWMEVVGAGRAAGFTLNLLLFISYSVLVVRVFEPEEGTLSERAALLSIAVIGFAPSGVLHSTQPLKDDLALAAIAAACFGAARVLAPGTPSARRVPIAFAMAVALAVLAGVRSHMVLMVIAAFVCAGTVFVVGRLRARLLASIALVVLAAGLSGAAYQVGAASRRLPPVAPAEVAFRTPPPTPAAAARREARRQSWRFRVERWVTTLPSRALRGIRDSRQGFARSGGATNLARPDDPGTLWTDAQGLAIGLGATFVPISILKAVGVVAFDGGQGLLLLADADTLFLDVGVFLTLALWFRHRRGRTSDAAVDTFTIVYATLALVLLAYVVTNYGTLFRMRLMIVQAICMCLLAFAGSRMTIKGPGCTAGSDAR